MQRMSSDMNAARPFDTNACKQFSIIWRIPISIFRIFVASAVGGTAGTVVSKIIFQQNCVSSL